MMMPNAQVPMPTEQPTTIYVNDHELLTIQTTPTMLADWALGFLFTESFITRPSDLRRLVVDEEKGLIWADLAAQRPSHRDPTGRRYLTSGCGKGVTFSSVQDATLLQPVRHSLQVTREQLAAWMNQMHLQTPLYRESGGIHAAAAVLAPTGELIVREDIGRHNAVDKAIGASLRAGWPPEQVVMITSGRISYEMCTKLARYGIGVGASRTAATDQAFRLATLLGIDLVGYVRGAGNMVVYTAGQRIVSLIPTP